VSWLLHFIGVTNVSGRWYAFWSGFASILERLIELAVIAFILLRHHNCAVHRCWRIGHRLVDGSPYVVCRRHHPSPAPTHAHIISLHRQHTARLAAQAYRQAGTPAPPPPDASGERFYNHERDGL
jgi:hypothetical protein